MTSRNVRDAQRQGHSALPQSVRGRWLKHCNSAKDCCARSRTKLLARLHRPQSRLFLRLCWTLSDYFFFFSFYSGHIHCHPARPWQKSRLGEDAWLWRNPLFIYLDHYVLSGQQALLSKTFFFFFIYLFLEISTYQMSDAHITTPITNHESVTLWHPNLIRNQSISAWTSSVFD